MAKIVVGFDDEVLERLEEAQENGVDIDIDSNLENIYISSDTLDEEELNDL